MKIFSTVHNHTVLCDGRGTPEEMADAALAAGFTDLGFSGHGVTPFDPSYSLRDEDGYVRAIRSLAERYRGRLNVLCGVEQDYFAPVAHREAFDYLIGSVHYYRTPDGRYYSFDASPDELTALIDSQFGGDALACAGAYFALVTRNVREQRPTIVGHFDLVTVFNRDGRFFDEDDPAYRALALSALEQCAASGAVFEINAGAMVRGYRDVPYPAPYLLGPLHEMGAEITLTCDCHRPSLIAAGLEQAAEFARRAGFTRALQWRGDGFAVTGLN